MPPRPGRSSTPRPYTSRSGTRLKRPLVLGGLAACVLTATVAGVHAQDGLGGFFERLFAPPSAAPAVSLPEAGPPAIAYREPRRGGASLRHRRTRYAALTRSEPLPLHVGQRQTPLDLKDGVTAAFLRDETLRPGDIVVLREGAQVFTGTPGRQHKRGDFDPASRSTRLDRKTRALLAAMVRPVGAAPSRVALRKPSATVAQDAPAAATRTEASLVRVVSPWRTTP